jgi:hypothetical protein
VTTKNRSIRSCSSGRKADQKLSTDLQQKRLKGRIKTVKRAKIPVSLIIDGRATVCAKRPIDKDADGPLWKSLSKRKGPSHQPGPSKVPNKDDSILYDETLLGSRRWSGCLINAATMSMQVDTEVKGLWEWQKKGVLKEQKGFGQMKEGRATDYISILLPSVSFYLSLSSPICPRDCITPPFLQSHLSFSIYTIPDPLPLPIIPYLPSPIRPRIVSSIPIWPIWDNPLALLLL